MTRASDHRIIDDPRTIRISRLSMLYLDFFQPRAIDIQTTSNPEVRIAICLLKSASQHPAQQICLVHQNQVNYTTEPVSINLI